MFIFILLFSITIMASVLQARAFQRLCRCVEQGLSLHMPVYCPRLSVILPCKGLDPEFSDNVQKLLTQDYFLNGKPNFEVIFAVASEEDPAYQALKEISNNQLTVPTKLIVAGFNSKRSQKLNNQIKALQHVSPDTEAFAFVDSDVSARQDFLKQLIARLDEPCVGATTGYRFYIPYKKDLPSLIRSLWNRMSAWELASPKYCFAWGGAMAIKRNIFEQANVLTSWDKSADDDLALTTAVKKLGLRIKFVPQCLVASHGDATFGEVLEWTNRQLILTKVYYPRLWLRGIARAFVMTIWLLAFLACPAAYLVSKDNIYLWGLIVGALLVLIEIYFLVKGQRLWQKVLNQAGGVHDTLWSFIMAIPLAHLTLPWMTLYSLFSNRIRWRGVTYELKSPSETLIV